ncbi:hypothetical protein B5M09_006764 [Aphanomyces astaci]|nr:hypothetical protein B5M09_006764 [Aphanomyces astaci]
MAASPAAATTMTPADCSEGATSPATTDVPADMRCRYAYKECRFVRSQRKNGKLHSLCELHRRKANSVQKLYAMKRRNTPTESARNRQTANNNINAPLGRSPMLPSSMKMESSHLYPPTHHYYPSPQHHHRHPEEAVDDDTYQRLMEIKQRIQDAWERRSFPPSADGPVDCYPSSPPAAYRLPSMYAAQY